MGALSLKHFSFEQKQWEIQKHNSFDPTDSFGSSTGVYVHENQVLLVEPNPDYNSLSTWLNNKSRFFFDSMFTSDLNKHNATFQRQYLKEIHNNIIKNVINMTYIVRHCEQRGVERKNFTFVFENADLELINLLTIIAKNYFFIKLRRPSYTKLDNSFESNYQTNTDSPELVRDHKNLYILVSSNSRYESSYFHLNLRQQFIKGELRCLILGSFLDLTFPTKFLGATTQTLQNLTEGNSAVCQELVNVTNNPIFIFNNELCKREDSKSLYCSLTFLNKFYDINRSWNRCSMINNTLADNGNYNLMKFKALTVRDLNNCCLLYFINISAVNDTNLKKIISLNLLDYTELNIMSIKNKMVVNQGHTCSTDTALHKIMKKYECGSRSNYVDLPTSNFYEGNGTFINTQGLIKRTTRILPNKEKFSNWQILKKLYNRLLNNLSPFADENNKFLCFRINRLSEFKNYTNFKYLATKNLTNSSYCLATKTAAFCFLTFAHRKFKEPQKKIQNSKFKYWLDDFYIGGKDGYSHHSVAMIKSSNMIRLTTTNFF